MLRNKDGLRNMKIAIKQAICQSDMRKVELYEW